MRVLVFVIVIIVAAVAGYSVLQLTAKPKEDVAQVVEPKAPAPQLETVDVIVAAKEIPIGTKLTPDLYDRQPWPKNLVLEQFVVGGAQSPGIDGMVTRSNFQAREPLIRSKLANPNDPGFFAAALPEGMRAVTIATNMVDGVAGFAFPGDRVDVMYTHEVQEKQAASSKSGAREQPKRLMVTEPLLTNVKVLAVNQLNSANTPGQPASPNTVTVEVKQEDAQRLRLAEKTGTLSLSLRSLKDRESTDIAAPTLPNNISAFAGGAAPKANEQSEQEEAGEDGASITVIRGVTAAKTPINSEAGAAE